MEGERESITPRGPKRLRRAFGDGQAGGQPRRLDAEQVDQPGQAVLARPLDGEVGWRFPWGAAFRPDAAAGGRQASTVEGLER
jgi:hypothetical protein